MRFDKLLDFAGGAFDYHYAPAKWFCGYARLEVGPGQFAFVARPEKALLDLIRLRRGGDGTAFLDELRLQNLERLDLRVLSDLAERHGRAKLARAACELTARVERARAEFETV